MSEENKVLEEVTEEEEKQEIDYTDQNEPIDSIEKTVADLKKKIQELAEETPEDEEGEAEIPDFINAEKAEEEEDLAKKAEKFVSDSLETIKTGTSKIMENPELQKTVDFIKENAVKAADSAKAKVDELASSPQAEEFREKTASAFDKAKKYAEETGAAISDTTKKAVKSADEFMNKPEVKKAVDTVAGAVKETANKASEALKNIIARFRKAEEEITEEAEAAAAEAEEAAAEALEEYDAETDTEAESTAAPAEDAPAEEKTEE